MAKAFKLAVESGVLSRQAGMMPQVNYAKMSTPLAQTLFWNEHA
jgi:thiazole synthase ThiGH ThiG subunit